MSYTEAIEYLYSSLPVYQNIGPGAYKPGLANSELLDALFGHPHRAYPCIHIAGTNGKGSTAHTLAAILQESGLRTGLYTSPHIYDFGERIRVDGRKIDHDVTEEFVDEWKRRAPEGLRPSFFELTSTLAFKYFERMEVDVAVIETGLGGRLDSTNIITPILSIVTNISLDHTALLGNTTAVIAAEKAGIFKPGVPALVGEWTTETRPVFERAAIAAGSPLYKARPVEVVYEEYSNFYPETPFGPIRGELQGSHQALNAATVMSAITLLRDRFHIPDKAVIGGFARVTELTGLFGRWSRIADAPLTIADTGHNSGGWEHIVANLNRMPHSRKAIVMGFVADKDLGPVFALLRGLHGNVKLYFSAPASPRGLSATDLAAKARAEGFDGTEIPDVNRALRRARADVGPEGMVLTAGSNFLISDLETVSLASPLFPHSSLKMAKSKK